MGDFPRTNQTIDRTYLQDQDSPQNAGFLTITKRNRGEQIIFPFKDALVTFGYSMPDKDQANAILYVCLLT